MLAAAPAAVEPVVVYTGPTRTGAALIAAVAADADQQATPSAKQEVARRGKKPDAADEASRPSRSSQDGGSAKPDAKPAAAKPAAASPRQPPSRRRGQARCWQSQPRAAAAAKPAKPKAATKPAKPRQRQLRPTRAETGRASQLPQRRCERPVADS